MNVRLLFETREPDLTAALPPGHQDLLSDLDLPALFRAMAGGDDFIYDIVMRVVLAGLKEPGEIRYRQEVLADCLAHPDVVRRIYGTAIEALAVRRGAWRHGSELPTVILSGGLDQLDALTSHLEALRAIADEHLGTFESKGMRKFLSSLQQDLDDEYFGTLSSHLAQLRFGDGQLMSAALDRDNSGTSYVLRRPTRSRSPRKVRLGRTAPETYWFSVPPRDQAAARALSNLAGRGTNEVANVVARAADHIVGYFSKVRAELGFYLGGANLHQQLGARGVATSFPEPRPWAEMAFESTELRDVCLVLRGKEPVVGNDVHADGKILLIVTGASSGGKTTFLRSVGLAHLMLRCGLFVVAGACRASVCRQVFTHFAREEDLTMTTGRLDEELRRMSAIAETVQPGSIVLLNESFAATNEREGSEIARQVVQALLSCGIRVCFVSHLYDFATRVQRELSATTLSLRAHRRGVGAREFTLEVAPPLPTSFGEELYARLGGWLGEAELRGSDGRAGAGCPPPPPSA